MSKRSRALWLVLTLLLPAGACYTLQPAAEPRTGSHVRVRLTTESAIHRSRGLEDPIRNVDGRLIERSADGLALDVLVARSPSVFQEVEIRDTVRLASTEVEALFERQLHPTRTALAAGAVAVGAALVVGGIVSIVGGTEGDDGGDSTIPASVVPLRPALSFQLLRLALPGR